MNVSLLYASLSLWACTYQKPARSAPASDPIQMEAFSEGDSAHLARALERECKKAAPRSDCYERLLASAASTGRVRLAMGALGQLGAADKEVQASGHVYAHAIGIAAGKRPGDISETFGQCSESYQSGCYHGVIQARFAALGNIGPGEVNGMCQPFRTSESKRWIRFQCVHGVGHGLTSLNDHDLIKALSGCDMLSDSWDRSSCYGGVFMENIVNVTNPHHPASTLAHHDGKAEGHASGDEHAGMAGMEHEHAAAFKAIDPKDPQYPCSIVAERYQAACYQMQTSVMLYNNKGDVAATARDCDRAPHTMIITCYTSLGRDISSLSMQNHAEATRMCALGTISYQPWCYFGLVKNIIDLNSRPSDGIALCRDVPTSSGKLICYVAVGEQIALLATGAQERQSLCAPSEALLMDACLYGARVIKDAPPGLAEAWAGVNSR